MLKIQNRLLCGLSPHIISNLVWYCYRKRVESTEPWWRMKEKPITTLNSFSQIIIWDLYVKEIDFLGTWKQERVKGESEGRRRGEGISNTGHKGRLICSIQFHRLSCDRQQSRMRYRDIKRVLQWTMWDSRVVSHRAKEARHLQRIETLQR